MRICARCGGKLKSVSSELAQPVSIPRRPVVAAGRRRPGICLRIVMTFIISQCRTGSNERASEQRSEINFAHKSLSLCTQHTVARLMRTGENSTMYPLGTPAGHALQNIADARGR